MCTIAKLNHKKDGKNTKYTALKKILTVEQLLHFCNKNNPTFTPQYFLNQIFFMQKNLLLTSVLVMIAISGFSQSDKFWSANNENKANIITDKAVARLAYPL